MSEENVENIRRGYGHFMATGEVRAHADLVWDVSRLGWPDRQIYAGAEGANQFMAEWADVWDDWEMEAEDDLDARRYALRSGVDAPGRTGDQDADVRERGGSPRSRRATRVGNDVGIEHFAFDVDRRGGR